MGTIIWSEPAVSELKAIAEYIELDKPQAAKRLVQKIFKTVESLKRFPHLGKTPKELTNLNDLSYRELYIKPCRILYRTEKQIIYVVTIIRMERDLNPL